MKIGRSRVHTELYAQGFAGRARLFQFLAQVRLANNLRRTLLDVGQLLVNRRELWHQLHYKECRSQKAECRSELALSLFCRAKGTDENGREFVCFLDQRLEPLMTQKARFK